MKYYKIVTTPRQDRLEEQVNNYLSEGWDLCEGPKQSNNGWLQGLTKEVKVKKSAAKVSE